MDRAAAVAYLTERERFGIKLGLENIARLVEALGHPERSYQSVLVAGTNGKGSTAALLESILRAAGYATGRYTSPHLVRLEERMSARGELIREPELTELVAELAEVVGRLRRERLLLTEPTFFEVTTACCLEFFRRARVEVAVLEVGMGGRWDATNIAPAALTAITNVAFDHERFLGTTLAAIAAEKAATIKPGRPVVTAVRSEEALSVIRAEAARQNAPLHRTSEEVAVEAWEAEGGQRVRLTTPARVYREVFLPLAGEHQLENLALAVRAAELLQRPGFPIPHAAIGAGVAGTRWPARLERVRAEPALLIDAAHNPAGVEALVRYLEAHPRPGRVLLFAVMKDKKVEAMAERLFPCFERVVVSRPENPRAQDPRSVVEWAGSRGFPAESVPEVGSGLERARRLAGPSGEVVVAGSIFLAGEVKALLEREAPET
jgi:dihydrofolate synthase/folylpolyglutamate synthase